jgi:hypothetical protein
MTGRMVLPKFGCGGQSYRQRVLVQHVRHGARLARRPLN